jgi:hypothetical protein
MGTLVGQASSASGFSRTRTDGTDYFNTVSLYARQRMPLPLLLDHDPDLPAGEILYIEEHPRSGVVIVAHLDRPLNGRQHLSLGIGAEQITAIDVINGLAAQRRADSAVLREISLVDRPGAAVHPVSHSERDLDPYNSGGWPTTWPDFHRQIADRAVHYLRSHHNRSHIEVQYIDPALDALADEHLDDVRRRRDLKLIDAHERQRTADHLARKFARQGFEVPPELVTHGTVHRRINVGHVVAVR